MKPHEAIQIMDVASECDDHDYANNISHLLKSERLGANSQRITSHGTCLVTCRILI